MKKLLFPCLFLSFLSAKILAQSTAVTSYGVGAGTGGTTNAFFGGSAGRITTGRQNTFLGPNAGYFHTTGTNNVFVGNASGWFSTTGSNNVNIGDGASYFNATGSANTAIGNGSLFKNTNGSNNTALGNGAGYNALGSGNVFLGFNAGNTETGSNKLYIANSGTTSPLIFGDFVSGNVAIGKNTAGYKLDVNGAINASSFLVNGSPIAVGSWNVNSQGIDYSGNVGVGTTTPAYKLDVAGTINASSILINGQPFAGGGSQWATSGTNINFLAGNVGIGTATPGSFKLAVNGKIWAQEVQVALTNPGPDYVFEPSYNLMPLSQIEAYIKEHKHLPEVPSAKEMETNGVQLSEMNMLLLKKLEELTLHVIELEKKLNSLSNDKKK